MESRCSPDDHLHFPPGCHLGVDGLEVEFCRHMDSLRRVWRKRLPRDCGRVKDDDVVVDDTRVSELIPAVEKLEEIDSRFTSWLSKNGMNA
jgi:hypothetical protein